MKAEKENVKKMLVNFGYRKVIHEAEHVNCLDKSFKTVCGKNGTGYIVSTELYEVDCRACLRIIEARRKEQG